MQYKSFAFFVFLWTVFSLLAKGQSVPDPTFRLTDRKGWISVGHHHNYDDYLSSVLYKGTVLAAGVEQTKLYSASWPYMAKYEGARFSVSSDQNPAKNANMAQGELECFYGAHFVYPVSDNLKLNIGAYSQLDLGARSLLKNSNNPLNVVANTDFWISLRGLYRLSLWGRDFVFIEHFSTPVFGVMFSPKYTELYYDIHYVDDYSGNFVLTTYGLRNQFRNDFSISLPVGRCTFSLGYVLERAVCNVNKLESRMLSSSFQIGFRKKLYSFKGKQSIPAMFISSDF